MLKFFAMSNIKSRAYFGAILVVGSYGFSQVIRLGGNLILTRLLVPELFGLSALAQVFIMGLHLFSDIGLGPGIIRSKRVNDPSFLNTAWTLQILRGCALWLICILIAIPVAHIYGKVELKWILPILGLNCIFYGLNSTSIYTLNKEVKLTKLTIMEIGSQVIGLICMTTLAYIYRNIWALVAGALTTTALKSIWSHFLEAEKQNRLQIDKSALSELMGFGKWILISTAMMFLATQADRLILGKLFALELFGIYSIAIIFAELPKQVISQLSGKIIFPVMANFAHLERSALLQTILRKRKQLLIPLTLMIAVLACFGDLIITTLYDVRYLQAAWMLPLLAMGIWPLILYATIDRVLYVIDKPVYPAIGNSFKFLYVLISLPLLFSIGGKLGAIVAVALNSIPAYAIVNIGLKKEGLSGLKQDLWATILFVAFLLFFLTVRHYLGLGLPIDSYFAA